MVSLDIGAQGSIMRHSSTELDVHKIATEVHSKVHCDEVSDVKKAVLWIQRATEGSHDGWNGTAWQFKLLCLERTLMPLWEVNKYAILFVMLFEVPVDCAGSTSNCSHLDKALYSWPVCFLSLRATAAISIGLYSITLLHLLLRMASGTERKQSMPCLLTGIFATLGLVGAVSCFFSVTVYEASFIFRPVVFLFTTKKARDAYWGVLRSTRGYIDVLLTLFLCVFTFNCIGMVLFVGTPEGHFQFSNWREGLFNLWILFTTSNSPEVFMHAYNSNKLYFFFFFAYLVCALYLLGSVLLARVFDSYKNMLKDDLKTFHENQDKCVNEAFKLLAADSTGDQNTISADEFCKFFVEYCDPSIGGIQVADLSDTEYNWHRANQILRVFCGIDLDTCIGIDLHDFKGIMSVFTDRRTYIPKRQPPKIERHNFMLAGMEQFYLDGTDIFGMHVAWDQIMDCVIAVGTCFTLWQAVWFCSGTDRTLAFFKDPVYWIIFTFSVFYASSLTIKINSLGFERFWHKEIVQHRFDFFNVYSLLGAELIYMFVYSNHNAVGLERAIILLSMARSLRLFRYVPPVKHLGYIIVRLMPTYENITLLLVVVFFIYSSIGRWCFGGVIYSTNPALVGSQFAQQQYWSLNFNDCASSLVTLFVLMVVNNWYIIADAYMRAAGTWWASLFFVTFFVKVNLIVLNILMALILECTSVLAHEVLETDEQKKVMTGGGCQERSKFMLRRVLGADDEHEQSLAELYSPTNRKVRTLLRYNTFDESQLFGQLPPSFASASDSNVSGQQTEITHASTSANCTTWNV